MIYWSPLKKFTKNMHHRKTNRSLKNNHIAMIHLCKTILSRFNLQCTYFNSSQDYVYYKIYESWLFLMTQLMFCHSFLIFNWKAQTFFFHWKESKLYNVICISLYRQITDILNGKQNNFQLRIKNFCNIFYESGALMNCLKRRHLTIIGLLLYAISAFFIFSAWKGMHSFCFGWIS